MSETEPWLRVVSGDPTPDEVAAVVTVLAAASRPAVSPPVPRSAAWSDPAFCLPDRPIPGPDAWWASALPR